MGWQYIRDTVLIGAGVGNLSELKIEFDVKKTTSGVPNEATISVYNLSEATRNSIKEEFTRFRLESGYVYAGNRGVIFDGFVRDVEHTRHGVDIETKITLGDGDKAYRKGVVSKSYPRNTKIKDVVLDLHSKMEEVDLGILKGLDDLPPTRRPLSFMGPISRAMNYLSRSYDFYWSIQDGALETIPVDGAIDHVIEVSPRTGMVDVPTITDKGVVVKILLNPDARPGRLFNLNSETASFKGANGLYRISSVGFSGDNRDGDHVAEIEGELYRGGKALYK